MLPFYCLYRNPSDEICTRFEESICTFKCPCPRFALSELRGRSMIAGQGIFFFFSNMSQKFFFFAFGCSDVCMSNGNPLSPFFKTSTNADAVILEVEQLWCS